VYGAAQETRRNGLVDTLPRRLRRFAIPVTAVGGFFFRAADPDALQQWYRDHLGVVFEGGEPWNQEAGPTVFMPFPADTDYFPVAKQWMINFRVTELDQILSKLRQAGIEVQTDPAWDMPETGRFARVHDPEGNAVELWEPPRS
jgi:predicted enzyme related to lactoylglutathione lyase